MHFQYTILQHFYVIQQSNLCQSYLKLLTFKQQIIYFTCIILSSMQIKEQRVFEAHLFKEYLRSKLITLLDSIPGKKLLMLDAAVRNLINMIVERKLFSQHGIPEEGGILNFEVTRIDNNFTQVIVMVPPNINSMEILANLYQANKDRSPKTYYAVFWPKKSMVCKQYLETRGLLSSFQLRDFSFDLIPLDNDLYSLQMKSFKDTYIDNEYKIYNYVAESILRLQTVFGRVRNIFGKGTAARNIYEILLVKQKQLLIDQIYGDIQHLLIFDRNIDLVTPLLKQMTYEGMIDEFYGISGNLVKLPQDMLQETNQRKPLTQVPYKIISLSGQKDFIYDEVRILMISACRNILKNKAISLQKMQDQAKDIKDVKQKAQLTKKITSQKQYLTKHINISAALAESMKTISFHKQLMIMQRCLMSNDEKELIEYYQNLIPFGLPLQKILRPLSLYSLVYKGINKKIYKTLCNDILHCYGAQQIITLTNLNRLGMLTQQGQSSSLFTQVRKQLKLINEQPINHENPTDISYSYGGYAPIIPKLVQNVIRNGWKTIPKALKYLPGETLMPNILQNCPSTTKRPVILVYFVGGVTYGEIAALRLLGKLFKREMVIATTQILNGQSMIKSLIEKDL